MIGLRAPSAARAHGGSRAGRCKRRTSCASVESARLPQRRRRPSRLAACWLRGPGGAHAKARLHASERGHSRDIERLGGAVRFGCSSLVYLRTSHLFAPTGTAYAGNRARPSAAQRVGTPDDGSRPAIAGAGGRGAPRYRARPRKARRTGGGCAAQANGFNETLPPSSPQLERPQQPIRPTAPRRNPNRNAVM